MTCTEVDEILTVLRKHGVRRATVSGLSVEFGLGPAIDPARQKTERKTIDVCKCGHPMWNHTAAGCVEMCPIDLCVDEGE